MKSSSLILLVGLFNWSLYGMQAAEAKAEVKEAIKQLGGKPNYSWTWTPKTEGSQAARRQGPISGATEKDGFTILTVSIGENSAEVVAKGDKMAINYEGEWHSAAEIGENNRAVQRLKAVKSPVDEAEGLLDKAAELKKEADGTYSGEMRPDSAKELFGQLGRRAAEAPSAKGTMKFRMKNGVLDGYEYKVEGKITAGEDKKDVDVSRTVTVEIKDVGSTKVTVPEEAKKKVS